MRNYSGDLEPKEPDSNGKSYTFFQLVESGKDKGKYKLAALVTQSSSKVETMIDHEFRDLINSGFEVVEYIPRS